MFKTKWNSQHLVIFSKVRFYSYIIIFYIIIFLDNSLDQKKLNEYNVSKILEKPQTSPNKSKEKSIKEEIQFLTRLSLVVQEKNEGYKKMIEEKLNDKTQEFKTIEDDFEFELDTQKADKKNKNNIKKDKKLERIDLILKNSAYHIYKMQLTQFAENIKRICKNKKTNQYLISFDSTDEEIPAVLLNEKDYKNLINIRDKYSSNDILSTFISKENCINPSSISSSKKNKSLTPIKINNHPILAKTNKEIAKYKDDNFRDLDKNDIIMDNKKGNLHYLDSYNICHQCKLQKMDDDLIKCQYLKHIPNQDTSLPSGGGHQKKNNKKNSNINIENPVNYFFIGQSAIILANKIYYLKNYDDSVKELVDSYFLNRFKEYNKKCEKCYCKNCLRTTYDFDLNDIKKKNFRCPYCLNRCNCSRCIRHENLIKQIAYYLNNYGDINKLYDYLVKQNPIFEKLKDYLVLSKFICFDFNTKISPNIKINYGGKINNEKIAEEEKNNIINFEELLKYKKNLEKTQSEFSDIFDETNLEKQLYECELLKLKETKEKNEAKEAKESREYKDGKETKESEDKKVKEKCSKSKDKKLKKILGKKIKRPKKKKK